MPQLNLTTTRNETHTLNEGTATVERYWPYPPGKELEVLRQAIWIIDHNIYTKNNACNRYYKSLPGGRSFDEVWEDTKVLLNIDPDWRLDLAYVRFTGSLWRVSITATGFADYNRWQVAGLIIHELAHINGAPGKGSGSTAADSAQIHCGLANFFDNRVG